MIPLSRIQFQPGPVASQTKATTAPTTCCNSNNYNGLRTAIFVFFALEFFSAHPLSADLSHKFDFGRLHTPPPRPSRTFLRSKSASNLASPSGFGKQRSDFGNLVAGHLIDFFPLPPISAFKPWTSATLDLLSIGLSFTLSLRLHL